MARRVDIVVVGAGISGLVAARRGVEAGASVAVLEARSRVGGRLKPIDVPGGRPLDGGGEYIGPPQDRVMSLVDELGLGLESFASAAGGDFARVRGDHHMRTDENPCEDANDRAAFDAAFAEIEALALSLPEGAPWEHPQAAEWDGQTFRTWARERIPSAVAREAVEAQLMPAGGAQDVSFLNTLRFVHGHGSLKGMYECEEFHIAGGTFQLPMALAAGLDEDVVVLDSPVRRVEHSAAGITVRSDRLDVEAGAAIMALAPGLLERIEFVPDLPPRRLLLQRSWSQQPSVKSVVVYPRRWWAERGYNGIGLSDRPVASFVVDASPADGSIAVLESFTNAVGGLPAWVVDDPDRRRREWFATIEELFGPDAPEPLAYLEGNWFGERWSAGCGSSLQCGVLTGVGDTLGRPVGRIFWAGTEVATRWSTYIDGAIRAGEAAAADATA